jgi:RNA 2',3'-cyclic 3'-phosphodiesterase
MRTFIAIPLPDECRTLLDRMQQKLRPYGADVRWVAIPSIHLTLKFLGEVDPDIIPDLAQSLESGIQSQCSFSLRLHDLGCFPNPKNPRVIWCGIDGDTGNLSRLQQQVEAICAQFGFAPENRGFRPHLTLGRVNGKRNLQPLLECIKMGTDWESGFAADHFNIYKSTLKPQGAVYSILKTIALSA